MSLAPTYFISQSALTPLLLLSTSQPFTLGCDVGPPLCGGFLCSENHSLGEWFPKAYGDEGAEKLPLL